MPSATSACNGPALVVNMKTNPRGLLRSGRDGYGTWVSSNYRRQLSVSHMARLRRKKGLLKTQPELNFSYSFTMPLPDAALFHFRRIARRGAGCISFGTACRTDGGSGICGPRTVAAPAGLWTRRAHEDRNRPGALSLGRASWQNNRLADRRNAGESRLAELERVAAGGGGRSGETQACGIAASGPCRSSGGVEVRFHGSALCSGARLGARIGGAGRDWSACQVAAARAGRG